MRVLQQRSWYAACGFMKQALDILVGAYRTTFYISWQALASNTWMLCLQKPAAIVPNLEQSSSDIDNDELWLAANESDSRSLKADIERHPILSGYSDAILHVGMVHFQGLMDMASSSPPMNCLH